MEHRDPYSLIREATSRIRRRERANLLLPCVAPVLTLIALGILGRLPAELFVAGLIAVALALLHATTLPPAEPSAAARIDRVLGARDHFLTLATVGREASSPLLSLVESGAGRAGANVDPATLVPPVERRRFFGSAVLSGLLFAVVWLLAAPVVSSDPSERLAEIAKALLESENPADRAVAAELETVVELLRDPSRSPEEKRQAAAKALQQLEERSSGGEKGAGGQQEGEPQGGGTATGEQATGASEELRNEAREQLGKAAGRQSGSGTEGKSGEQQGPQDKGQENAQPQGGLEGPEQPKGAAEREGKSEGNRAGPGEGKSRDARAEGGADTGRDDASPPRDKSAAGEGERPEPGTGTSGASGRPQASDDSQPAERYYEAGEGPEGWKIVDGRYVRVRIPEESDAVDVERVRKPGRVDTETPFGNAPMPPAGRPGEIHDTQPLPLEYRSILRGEEGGDR